MEILLVEDNEADVVLMGEALREIKADVDLVVARSGEEGLERLSGEFPLPDIMILDLNLPGKHGTVVLQEMKED
ncbi:MAG: DNA-binding response OmpR family regulator, partial [Pseudoalteromonas tetraodonis]